MIGILSKQDALARNPCIAECSLTQS